MPLAARPAWSSSMEMVQDASGPRLREVSRRRLLEEMFRKVLENGALQPTQDQRDALKSEGAERRYVVLVVDAATLRMLTAVCQIHDLLEEGVCLVELIDSARQPLPVLDAIYFITPSEANVRQLVEDAVYGGEKKRSKYKSFHVFFTHKIGEDLMAIIASSREAVQRIGSFAEANLSFIAYDDRTFHFADPLVFQGLFEGAAANLVNLSITAERLATVFASLGVLQPKIRVAKSAGDGMSLSKRLATDLQMRLSEINSKGPLFKRDDAPLGPHTLIVLDRSHDWPAMLAHDLHYEAAIYDLLGSSTVSVDKGVFKYKEAGSEKDVVIGDEKDGLWKLYRHMPLWEVNDLVVQEVNKWTQQDKEMRNRTTAATSSSNMASMATNAMNALQSLPEHKERFAKLSVHSDICHQLFSILEGQKLIDVGTFEQEMLTSVDHNGRDCLPRYIEKELDSYLGDPDIPYSVKMRMLMLFCAAENQLDESERDRDRIKALARRLPGENRKVVTNPEWLKACGLPAETAERAMRRRNVYREKAKTSNLSPTSAKLTRWQPRVREIMEKAAKGELSHELFPELGADGETAGKSKSKSSPSPLVIVYIVGGFTLNEARQAHEVSQTLGVEILIGGNCILTADTLIEEIKRRHDTEGSLTEGGVTAGSAQDVAAGVQSAAREIGNQLNEAKGAKQQLLKGAIFG